MAKVAMLLDAGFDDAEFRIIRDRLEGAGHHVEVLGRSAGSTVHGRRGAEHVTVGARAADRVPDDYAALVIPGGHAPDLLRQDEAVVGFVRSFAVSGLPVAAIGHGPQLLIEADVVQQHELTSWRAIRTDLKNAGAMWLDEPVVEDPPFITAREPADLERLVKALRKKLE